MLPAETRVARGARPGVHYIISPNHHCNLQTLLSMRDECGDGPRLDEQRARRIFKQVARLVHLCHRIGIYFHDLVPKKFALADRHS